MLPFNNSFSGGGGGNNGTVYYNGWAQPQMPSAANPQNTNDQQRLQQQQIDAQKAMQATGLQYGAANQAADRQQQQWSQLTGQGFTGGQNDANRQLQLALQNSSQGFQGTQAGLNRQLTTEQSALDRQLTAQQNDANRQLQYGLQSSQQGFEGAQAGLNRTFTGAQNDANRQLQQALQSSQLGFEGTQSGLQRDWQGQQNSQSQQFQGTQADKQRALELQLGMAPIDFAREKFNAVMPMIGGAIGGIGGIRGGGGGGGGLSPQQQTQIGDIWNQGQIDQQVNAAKAGDAQQAATASNAAARNTAGKGFGSSSPLLAALQGQIQTGRMATDAESERGIRLNSAQANAQNRLQTGSLAEQQWLDAQDQNLRRQQLGYSGPASLLAAMGGFL